jgi:aspartate carbamoyltransferase catalytic subunit
MVQVFDQLEPGLEGLDVVVALRMQLERQEEHFVPNLDEYSREYCISERLLSKVAPNSIVIHPGPMNRGTEITSDVADGPRSLIRQQVTNGVAVRMAVGGPFPGLGYFLQSVSSTLLWPLADVLLLLPQRRAVNRDENRPI